MTLYLYENHSYYNRKIVRYKDIWQYDEAWGSSSAALSGVNFNPNNGITTTQVMNYDIDSPFADGSAAPSYCIVCDTYNNIVSRWWITSHTRIRNGQFGLTLVRDVIADYYDEVMNAPSFIRKGYIRSVNDPAIFNSEDMTFNQIKTKETQIKDKSGAAWYVAYISKDVSNKLITIPAKAVNTTANYDSLSEYPFAKYTAQNPYVGDYTDVTFQIYGYNTTSALFGIIKEQVTFRAGWDENGRPKTPPTGNGWYDFSQYLGTGFVAKGNYEQGFKYNPSGVTSSIFDAAGTVPDWKAGSYAVTGAHTADEVSSITEENGRFIRVGDKAYKIKVVTYDAGQKTVEVPNANIYANKFRTVANNSGAFLPNEPIKGNFSAITYSTLNYYIVPEEVDETGFSFTIPEKRQHTAGVPYDIVAIPATYLWLDDGLDYSTNIEFSQAAITSINTDLGSGSNPEIYDIQLLPYCPLPDDYLEDLGYGNGRLLTERMTSNQDLVQYEILSAADGNERTVVVYAENAEFEKVLTTNPITVPDTSLDFKVADACDVYRLCSPNYNGQFEFSATQNGGVSQWRIAFTYKPYTPYIRVAPDFGRMYGKNFFDARGLICGGDFSISQTNDAWVQYELQNKNYQVMFDRQIENMRIQNKYASVMDHVNAFTGTASGAVSGVIGGGMVGGGVGAAIGGIAGGVTSALGGAADIFINSKLRKEQMDYTKDLFGYQLATIKALPYSLTKVGSQNADFKFFPFVEYYTATDMEKQALRDKLTWNGMTVGRIGYFSNFIRTYYTEEGNFIQGQPIRLDYLGEDSQVAEAIAAELQTGVYIL